jgi:hypothetical protein
MPPSEPRLPTLCEDCSELFWWAVPTDAILASCPTCGRDVPAPAGRFAGIRNLVAWVGALTPEQRTRLEQWLTWDESRLHQKNDDSDLESLRRRLTALDLGSSLFWRQCFVFAVQEVAARPNFTTDDASVTELARVVAQRALAARSYEPRAY